MASLRGRSPRYLARRARVRLLALAGVQPRTPELNLGLLDVLDPWSREKLLSMYRAEPQVGADGEAHAIGEVAGMSPEEGRYLYDLYVSLKPRASLEIGLAFAYSTIYFLAAMAKNGSGTHTAVDPLQSSIFFGVGLVQAEASLRANGLGASSFRLLEERSDRAAVDLARSGARFEFIFIDGNHRFDDVITDFYLCAPLCAVGGYVVLHDMWMSSINSAADFLRANRTDFEPVTTDAWNLAVFRKVSEDERDWRHFRHFKVLGDQG